MITELDGPYSVGEMEKGSYILVRDERSLRSVLTRVPGMLVPNPFASEELKWQMRLTQEFSD